MGEPADWQAFMKGRKDFGRGIRQTRYRRAGRGSWILPVPLPLTAPPALLSGGNHWKGCQGRKEHPRTQPDFSDCSEKESHSEALPYQHVGV